jgi:Tol biopolymer transport system component
VTESNADLHGPSRDRHHAERLDSWKEIAAYLRRDVSTAQRWEKREAMPVHRHRHDKLGSVYAFKAELDVWAATRQPRADSVDAADMRDERAVPDAVPDSRRRWFAASIGAIALAAAAAVSVWQLQRMDYFWRNPLANARFHVITDFDGTEHSAAISRDGRLAAFLSGRDGQVDVWVTQIGTGQFHNVTAGRVPELVNRSVRTMEFSPDASLVSFWVGKSEASSDRRIGIWVAPTLAGDPRPFLEGVAEINWSPDGRTLAYHTPAAGDPLFVKAEGAAAAPIFSAPLPQHSHFPTWSPDQRFIYFVQGNLPNDMDIFRIRINGGTPERMTFHHSRVTHPTFVDRSTLLYLAAGDGGDGSRIYGLNVDRRVPHRLSNGLEQYTSLAASADGRRLVATASHPRTSLWRVPLSTQPSETADLRRINLPSSQGRLPRVAPGWLLFVSSNGTSDAIWKLVDGIGSELWTAPAGHIISGAAIAPGGDQIALALETSGRTRLIVMNADGTAARGVGDSLEVRGAPVWSPDGGSLVVAANDRGKPHLVRVVIANGAVDRLIDDYSLDPAWAPRGEYLVYSGRDIGTTFPVKAVTEAGRTRGIPELVLTRGARRFRFLPGQTALVVLRGDIEHKNLWAVDLEAGTERQLTNFGREVVISDFDISPDGSEIVIERVQDDSDIVLIDVPVP